MHVTLALVPRRVLDLWQFLSDAQVWMNDYRWYDESELWRRQVCFLAGMNDTGVNPSCSPHFPLSTSHDCVATCSFFCSFELSFPLIHAHSLLVFPSSSIYYLIPTNEFETQHARDAHKIEVAEVSEEHSQGRHRAGKWNLNAVSEGSSNRL